MFYHVLCAGLLLEHLLPTLFLRREASDGPDFDLDAVVELLSPHIPHTLVGSRNGPILFPGRKRGFRNLTLEALHAFMHLTLLPQVTYTASQRCGVR